MNDLDFSNQPVKKQNTEYFIHLVQIAMADNIICNNEREMLIRIGQKLGFTDSEIDEIMETTVRSDYIPPYELSKRFEQVYDIVKITLADGVIDKNEMRLASSFAAKSSFLENEIPGLLVLIISGIRMGKSEEELFEVYKKTRKYR